MMLSALTNTLVKFIRGDYNSCDKSRTDSDQDSLEEAVEGPAAKRRRICETEPDSTTWNQSERMARQGRLFEQRYYCQEPGKSDPAMLKSPMSNIASSKLADSQQAALSGSSSFVGGRVRNVCASSPAADMLWSTSRPLRRRPLAEPRSLSPTSISHINSKPKPRTTASYVGRTDTTSQQQHRRLMARECIKLEEKEIYKQMISEVSKNTQAAPAALPSAFSFSLRRDRSDGMENRIPEKRNKYMDSVIVLDDASNDPLKKRLDASSSLLSSFADSDFTALQTSSGRMPLSEAKHVSYQWNMQAVPETPVISEMSRHVPAKSEVTYKVSRPSAVSLDCYSHCDTSSVTARPPLHRYTSLHGRFPESNGHLSSTAVGLVSPPGDSRSSTCESESSATAVNGIGTSKNWQCDTVRSPVISEWEKLLKQSKYAQDDFLSDLTCDKVTSERRREMKAKETVVQFYKEKRLESEEQLVNRIFNSLTLSRRLPVPVEEPLYVPEESESEESVEEEEEESVDEFPELTEDQQSLVSRALKAGPLDQVLVEGFKLKLCRSDIVTLSGLNWLNDEVINFYMNLLMERGGQNNMPTVYSFSTFFYPKLISGGHQSVRRWTKQVDIFSYDYILVPVHLGMHWCLAVVDFRCQELRYYDSMGSNNERCLNALTDYLGRESEAKRQMTMSFDGWQFFAVKDIPQQMNGSDCGMFACKFAEYITRDAPITFCQEHMPYFRRRMIYEIVKKQLF